MKRMVDSELINSLGNDIKFDETGNVIVGKNLEVGGKVFTLNGKQWGIMPVIKINASGNYANEGFILSDALPSVEEGLISVSGIWYSADRNDTIGLCPAKTNFPKKSNKTRIENGILYVDVTDIDTLLELFPYIVTQLDLPDLSELQSQLYRHVITLNANSTADGSCRLEYISPKNLVCDSLQDLRTVLGNPQMNSYIASNPSGDLFGVVISPSTAQIKKVGTTSLLNITSVSDTVTTL